MKPIAFSLREGEVWKDWDSHHEDWQSFHSVLFDNGLIFDIVNGWRYNIEPSSEDIESCKHEASLISPAPQEKSELTRIREAVEELVRVAKAEKGEIVPEVLPSQIPARVTEFIGVGGTRWPVEHLTLKFCIESLIYSDGVEMKVLHHGD